MGRFRYTFDVLTNRKTFRDLKESSPLRKLLETIRTELSQRETTIEDEQIGTGDGTQKRFRGTLVHPGIKPGSLVIHAVVTDDTTETLTDNGDGTLTSDKDGISGTIDYNDGDFDVTFNLAPKATEKVYADCTYFTEFVSYGLNRTYEARFITQAWGDDLDKWGETLDLPRNSGETDPDYRTRLLTELRDFTACLTADAIKDAVEGITGVNRPDIVEIHTLAPDWPLEWWENVGSEHVTWCNWDDLVDFLVVLAGTAIYIDDEVIDTAIEGQTHFEGNLDHPPVKKNSLFITDGVEIFTDDGNGNLNGDKEGSGTINYDTGAYVLDFNSPPGEGVQILADYISFEKLEDIASAVVLTKFAPARCLIVTENVGGYYDLVRLVG